MKILFFCTSWVHCASVALTFLSWNVFLWSPLTHLSVMFFPSDPTYSLYPVPFPSWLDMISNVYRNVDLGQEMAYHHIISSILTTVRCKIYIIIPINSVFTPFTWHASGGNILFLAVPLALHTLFIPHDLDYIASVTFYCDDGLHSNHFLWMTLFSCPFLMLQYPLPRQLPAGEEPLAPFSIAFMTMFKDWTKSSGISSYSSR